MDESTVVALVKERLGIRNNVRDTFIGQIVKGVLSELENEKGLRLSGSDYNHMMFVVDYCAYRAEDPNKDMPRSLQFRLHNLMVHDEGGTE